LSRCLQSESLNARKGIKTIYNVKQKRNRLDQSESLNARKGIKTNLPHITATIAFLSESLNARKGIKTDVLPTIRHCP